MTESQLQLGNDLTTDKSLVYDQMKEMKDCIKQSSRKPFKTTDSKEAYDNFKQDLLNQCDKWVEDQREALNEKFSKI